MIAGRVRRKTQIGIMIGKINLRAVACVGSQRACALLNGACAVNPVLLIRPLST
jgi:hypothetical protein